MDFCLNLFEPESCMCVSWIDSLPLHAKCHLCVTCVSFACHLRVFPFGFSYVSFACHLRVNCVSTPCQLRFVHGNCVSFASFLIGEKRQKAPLCLVQLPCSKLVQNLAPADVQYLQAPWLIALAHNGIGSGVESCGLGSVK